MLRLCHLAGTLPKRTSASWDLIRRVAADSKLNVAPRILEEFRTRLAGHGLSGYFYHEPEIFKAELECIFHQEWLLAGHDVELPERGSYLTLQVGEFPVVVVRGNDDKIRAFHNVCRHRGFKLCTGARGKARAGGKRLVCPYHQWTYDTAGRLLHARDMGDHLNKHALNLKPVHLEMVSGHIFVSVAANPPIFQPVREMISLYAEPFNLQETKVAFQARMVEKGNWKIVMENNRECYHCQGAHPELRRSFPASSSGSLPTAAERAFAAKAESMGLPSMFVRAGDFQYRATRLALVKGARSMTMTGLPAVTGMQLGRMPARENVGDVLFYHYPSTWNHWMADHAISFRMLPISPNETELITTWLVPRDAVEGVHYDLPTLTEVWQTTNRQDSELVESVQQGVISPAFTPGPYNPVHEAGVIDFVDWYTGAMQQRLVL